MPDVSVVVPVYNNELNLPDLFAELEKLPGAGARELVFVDDGSADGSWPLLAAYAKRRPGTKAVRLSRNFGSVIASVAGLGRAAGKAAVLISADLQDPPELIPRMEELWRRGSKVVLAVRERREDPLLSRIFSALYYWVMRCFVLHDMPPGGFDFVLIDRQLIDHVVASREKNTTLMGLILWLGFERATIPYVRRERKKGRSMWTLKKKVKYFIDSVLAFSHSPIRPVQYLGLATACAGFLYALLLIYLRVTKDITLPGWTALMVVVLILGGVQMLVIGVIGEYVWRTLDEAKHRPLFVVDETVES